MKRFVIALIVLFYSMTTYAYLVEGDRKGNGGVGYSCKSGLFSETQIFLADTYEIFHESERFTTLINHFEKNSIEDALEYFLVNIARHDQQYATDLRRKLKEFNYQFVPKVKETNDHYLKRAKCPKGKGQIIQLARQEDNNIILAMDSQKMPIIEQAALRLHEARIGLEKELSRFKFDTTPVRKWVKEIVNLKLADLVSFVFNKKGTVLFGYEKVAKKVRLEFVIYGHANYYEINARILNNSKNIIVKRKAINDNNGVIVIEIPVDELKKKVFVLNYSCLVLYQNYARYDIKVYHDDVLCKIFPVLDINEDSDSLNYDLGLILFYPISENMDRTD
ncbi:MAG: hypothetical protein KAQ98_08120 [Bacteriovoracaceae bacterium]|nr:hypothetical protein [Bacteriovoracaceae bacterium]